MLKNIAISQVLDRLRFENPWWTSGSIDNYFSEMPRRAYYKSFCKLASETSINRAIVLMGPRRVGKTVLLYHFVQHIIESGFNPKRILFITVENPIYIKISLEELVKNGNIATGSTNNPNDRWYIIFDEIQYLKDWDIHLKSLVESYRNIKFIVSGSAAAALQYKSKESGAGRFTDFMLPPITFYEFIEMQGLNHVVQPTQLPWGENQVNFYTAADIKYLNKLFLDYINHGGYPEAIFSETIRNNPQRFIRSDVVDKVLLRDLPSLYGISDVQQLNSLFTTIAYNTANEFSLDTLSKQSAIPKNTIKKYLEYLEAAFLIKTIRRVDHAGKRFLRDNFFKIYLTNPSLRAALFSPIEATDEDMGQMTETAIYAQWLHRLNFTPWYARWNNGEVDMVGISAKNLQALWSLEIKWTDRFVTKPQELKSLIKFCKENNLSKALITTISLQEVIVYDNIELNFIPASSYAYTIGANTMMES